MKSIEPFIHRKIVVLRQDATVFQAARAMCENKIGCVVVSDQNGHIMGLVTDRDLTCYAIALGVPPDSHLSEVMTLDPICATPQNTLDEVIDLMVDSGVRRIPVVAHNHGKKERCVGIVTLDDLIVSRSIDFESLARIIRSQVIRRRRIYTRFLPGRPAEKTSEARSEIHMHQTLSRFYKKIEEKTGLNETQVPEVSWILLSNLVQRLHYTGAVHFISQLPHKIQDALLDLPAGPNRSVTAAMLTDKISQFLGRSETDSRKIIHEFYQALESLGNAQELAHVRTQLPSDLQELIAA